MFKPNRLAPVLCLLWLMITGFATPALAVTLTLHDQTAGVFTALSSANFPAPNDHFDNRGADDFVVPIGEQWTIEQVFAAGKPTDTIPPTVNLTFYLDNAGLPGAVLADFPNIAATTTVDDYEITLPVPLMLEQGSYWVSVQSNALGPGMQWHWDLTNIQTGHQPVWQNPPDGFSTGCADWAPIATCGFAGSGFAFSLHGSKLGCPSDTSTCTEGAKGKLLIKDGKILKSAWKGALAVDDIGDPSNLETLSHCIKVDGVIVYGAHIPAGSGSLLPGKKYLFKDGEDGITKAVIKNGKFGTKADNSNQPNLPLAGATVESVLSSSNGSCYKNTFTQPVKTDNDTTFQAGSP